MLSPERAERLFRTKLKNVKNGGVVDKTFRAGEKMKQAILERKPMQYTYEQDGNYFLMDLESYEQVPYQARIDRRPRQVPEGERTGNGHVPRRTDHRSRASVHCRA